MKTKKDDFKLTAYGDRRKFRRTIHDAAKLIPAYKEFLSQHHIGDVMASDIDELALTDKQNYCSQWSYFSLIPAEHWKQIYFVFRSSGASGKPFYWPQLKSHYKIFDKQLERMLIHNFNIDKKNTLAVIGLALGSWIGGDLISWALKSISLRSSYSLTVFSPGNQHEEILDIITRARRVPDQILLFMCPSAIGHLLLLAEQQKKILPMDKLRFAVIGEPFSERYRQSINKRCRVSFPDISMASAYGSADTGIIGVESRASAWFRFLLSADKDLRSAFEMQEPLANFYHIISRDAYIEVVDKELVFTLWQGVPLMRYNLHDRGDILSWPALTARLRKCKVKREFRRLQSLICDHGGLCDVLAVYGRSDRTLFLCGTNITEAMLEYAIQDGNLEKYLSGIVNVEVVESNNRQRLRWNIELKENVRESAHLDKMIYQTLVKRLGAVQPEFAVDYANIYRRWDDDLSQRIFELCFYRWPQLQSQQRAIKQKMIVQK